MSINVDDPNIAHTKHRSISVDDPNVATFSYCSIFTVLHVRWGTWKPGANG